MPIKLSLGLSKKLGLPAYSSLGASCHLECELDSSALQADAQRFHQEAQRLFNLFCRQAVEEQLASELPTLRPDARPNGRALCGQQLSSHLPCAALPRDELPEDLGTDAKDLTEETEPSAPWGLSQRQLAFIQDLAGQIEGLGLRRLPALVALQFAKNLTELSSIEASRLIVLLRQVGSGRVLLRTLLEDSSGDALDRRRCAIQRLFHAPIASFYSR